MGPSIFLTAEWPSYLHEPATLIFLIPILAILVGGITGLAKLMVRHRERMAMIERGIHPDHPPDPGKQAEEETR